MFDELEEAEDFFTAIKTHLDSLQGDKKVLVVCSAEEQEELRQKLSPEDFERLIFGRKYTPPAPAKRRRRVL